MCTAGLLPMRTLQLVLGCHKAMFDICPTKGLRRPLTGRYNTAQVALLGLLELLELVLVVDIGNNVVEVLFKDEVLLVGKMLLKVLQLVFEGLKLALVFHDFSENVVEEVLEENTDESEKESSSKIKCKSRMRMRMKTGARKEISNRLLHSLSTLSHGVLISWA